MTSKPNLPAIAAALALAAAPALAAESAPTRIANASDRVARCTVVLNTQWFTDVTLKPGQAYAHAFKPGSQLQLVCMRAKQGVYRLEAGGQYSVMASEGRIDLAEAGSR